MKAVICTRETQLARFAGHGFSNSSMSPKQIRAFCALDDQSEELLEKAMLRQGLSARAHDRIIKVSRTIADLEGAKIFNRLTSARRSITPRSTAIIGLESLVAVND